MAKWEFPSNNYGQINGISDSGVETFRGTPIRSLAREICQNSLDAILPDAEPVKVVFQTFEIPLTNVPGIKDLQDSFRRAYDFWKIQNNDKAKAFFDHAMCVANKQTVVCLRISDFNTRGLTGSHELYNSAWCNLIKSTGASDKESSSGGSFGIGKFAPFACSEFRTVFYSTIDKDGISANQGVSRLTSFEMENHEISQGIGFYGDERCTPVYTSVSLDPDFTRNSGDSGTDIFIAAFCRDDSWKDDLIISVLDSFLLAVFHQRLVVEVDGTVIDAATLPNLMAIYSSKFEENADKYYAVLTASDKESKIFEEDILGLGTVKLKMMIQPGMHRKCAMVRKTGMKILDRDNISSTIPFSAIMLVEGERLNEYLRNLENPQHTKWEPERSSNKSNARKVLSSMRKFIVDKLMEMQQLSMRDSIDPSVGEFLSYINQKESESQNEDRKEAITDKIKTTELKPIKIQTPSNSNLGSNDGNETAVNDAQGDIIEEGPPGEGSGGQNGKGNGGGGGSGQYKGEGNGSHPGINAGPNPIEHRKKLVKVRPASERMYCVNKAEGTYVLIFKPSVSATNGIMKIYQSAEGGSYEAILTGVHCAQGSVTFKGNVVEGLTFVANHALKITLTLDYHDYSSLEVEAYGHQT